METIKERIWSELAATNYGDFFITAEVVTEDVMYPSELDAFIRKKLTAIQEEGIKARKFIFREAKWKIYLTFFPRNEVVSEKYALKNKAYKQSLIKI